MPSLRSTGQTKDSQHVFPRIERRGGVAVAVVLVISIFLLPGAIGLKGWDTQGGDQYVLVVDNRAVVREHNRL